MAEKISNGTIRYDNTKYILKWISISLIIGVSIGLIAVLFEILLHFLIHWVDTLIIWIVILLPIVGLLISGLITELSAPEARGAGIDAIIHAYHHEWGIVKPRVIGAKFSASIATIGFGGSAGKEGPTLQISGGLSSLIGGKMNLSLKERKTLVLCGMSASFGAIFGAPLSGAIFGCEVIFRDEFEYVNILPCAISSVVGFLTYQNILSNIFGHVNPIFPSIEYSIEYPQFIIHILIFLGIGLICGIIGLLFIKIFYYITEKMKRWKKDDWFKTMIGGIGVMLLALLFMGIIIYVTGDVDDTRLILGMGWTVITELVVNENAILNFSLILLILLLLFKIFTTCFTIGSGGSGGVVGPSIVIGALVGGILALILGPFVNFDVRVLIGISSIVMFASIAHIPLTGMLMGGEMLGIPFIIPTLLASVIGSWVAAGDSIYHSSLISRSDIHKIFKKYKVIK
ncbi:MAG: chloride channel protein [Candidatus Helarchaeota archaeon]